MKIYVLGSTSFMKEMVDAKNRLCTLGFDGWIHPHYEAFVRGEKKELEDKIISIVAKEFGKPNLPIIANFDVGHSDPQFVLPLGVRAEIYCQKKKIGLIETWLK